MPAAPVPTPPMLLPLPGEEARAARLASALGWRLGQPELRRFPDGESAVRADPAVAGAPAVLVASLDRPDDKLVPLLLLAAAAREAGATQVVLLAPYLPYMRQDIAFRPGETASAFHVGTWGARHFDALVTVDPHLHRIHDLQQAWPVAQCRVLQAAPLLAAWIARELPRPLLVGPDEESAQWVADVAARCGAPHVVLAKQRRGDRDVQVSVPDVERWRDHQPVLVDDICSTARTMIETVHHLLAAGLAPPVCLAVHGLFAGDAYAELQAAGAARIVSTDSVAHASNGIGLDAVLLQGLSALNFG